MSIQTYSGTKPYVTRDESEIRELMHPIIHGNANQSLAEAIVQVGNKTLLHKHVVTEEIYHITQGQGLMTLGDDSFRVYPGDTILITPGTLHCIENTGAEQLKVLCCCSPAYSHEDTILT